MKRMGLLIALLLVSLTSFAEEATRCGHFQGKVIKIEQSYIYGWPQYKGTSVWNADKFKKGLQMGCDDQMDHLAVIVHWPEMTPNGGLKYEASTHNIVISLSAVVKDTDLSAFLNYYFEQSLLSKEQIENQTILDPETGLWKFSFKDPTGKLEFGNHFELYWGDEQDIKTINKRIHCKVFNTNISMTNCTLTTYLKDYKAILSVDFTYNLLPQWPELERQALAFISSKTIH